MNNKWALTLIIIRTDCYLARMKSRIRRPAVAKRKRQEKTVVTEKHIAKVMMPQLKTINIFMTYLIVSLEKWVMLLSRENTFNKKQMCSMYNNQPVSHKCQRSNCHLVIRKRLVHETGNN